MADWGRPHVENVISFTLNGAADAETFKKIDDMSIADQDRFRGAKFFLLCLVHGTIDTALAMEAADGHECLEKKVSSPIAVFKAVANAVSCDQDERIQERRLAHATSRLRSKCCS